MQIAALWRQVALLAFTDYWTPKNRNVIIGTSQEGALAQPRLTLCHVADVPHTPPNYHNFLGTLAILGLVGILAVLKVLRLLGVFRFWQVRNSMV